MRSEKVTLAIPHRLYEALEKHALEVGYDNVRQLLTYSPLYSLLVQRAHIVTAPIAKAPLDIQDDFIEEVVAGYERGEIRKGSYLEHLLTTLVERLGINMPPAVIKAVIADIVRERPPKKKPD